MRGRRLLKCARPVKQTVHSHSIIYIQYFVPGNFMNNSKFSARLATAVGTTRERIEANRFSEAEPPW